MSTLLTRIETAQTTPPPELPPAPAPDRRGVSVRGRVVLAAVLLWALSGIYIVLPDQQAVETVFGRVMAPRVLPGLHFELPWPIARATRIKVHQTQRLVVGGSLPDAVIGRTPPLLSQFLTGDQNILNVRVVVQYSVDSPVDYLFRTQDPAQVVGAAVESELARRIAHRGVDAVLTTEKIAIQQDTLAAAQSRLRSYQAGVLLSSINLESVAPPPETAAAFRDVASARADTARAVSDAQGSANDLIPKARGQAQQMLTDAQAWRDRKINEASGDAARFNQIAAEYAKASQVTGRRLYLETMEQVLPRIKKLIVDSNGNLDLTIVRKGDR